MLQETLSPITFSVLKVTVVHLILQAREHLPISDEQVPADRVTELAGDVAVRLNSVFVSLVLPLASRHASP